MKASYLNPKCESVYISRLNGYGVIAKRPIRQEELICIWGGRIVDGEGLRTVTKHERRHAVEVEEGFYLVPTGQDEDADDFNHSCNPNAGFRGQVSLVAMRDIEPGEEITFDYAMSDSTPYDEFICGCGSKECRGKITSGDWLDPKLWAKYAGRFSTYLQAKIDRLTVTDEL